MEAVYPFETLVLAYQSTRFHNPEEHKLIFAIEIISHNISTINFCGVISCCLVDADVSDKCVVLASLHGGSRIRRNVDKYLPHYIPDDGRSTFL
jgi:hypothetical protein